ncbi:MAG: sulfur transferase domain-containing protein [Thermoanaerobaculia bacterium]
MSSLKTLKYSFVCLTLLAIACAPEVEQTTPPLTRATSTAAEESAVVESLRPEDLLTNGLAPFEGEAILVGGQPTPGQLERARDLGYKTVINLRQPEEKDNTDPELVRYLEMTYVSLPIGGPSDITQEKARALADALEATESPVLVHCASGNRVGGLFAMKAFYVDGMSPEEALAVGKAAGMTRLEPTVREKLGLPTG